MNPDLLALAENRERFVEFVRRRVGAEDAEDLYQQALLRAAERIDTLRDRTRLDAWFYTMLRRAIFDYREQRSKQEAKLAWLEDPPTEPTSPCGCSLSVLAEIRPEYADIVRRVDVEEEPVRVVANALGITEGNAKVRLHRARRALKRGLWDRCRTDSVRACVDCGCE